MEFEASHSSSRIMRDSSLRDWSLNFFEDWIPGETRNSPVIVIGSTVSLAVSAVKIETARKRTQIVRNEKKLRSFIGYLDRNPDSC